MINYILIIVLGIIAIVQSKKIQNKTFLTLSCIFFVLSIISSVMTIVFANLTVTYPSSNDNNAIYSNMLVGTIDPFAIMAIVIDSIIILLCSLYKQLSNQQTKTTTDKNENETNQKMNAENKEDIKIIDWSDLTPEQQKPYIDRAIKQLFQSQLEDKNIELTRQQRALKKDSIDNNEFFIEDLTDEEKELVNTSAQELYKNRTNENVAPKETKNINKNEKLIKKGFKWVLYCFIATKLGTVTSFTGEKSNYDFRYLGFGIKLLVMTLWEGYTINKEDVLNYTITPSSALKERCVITLKNGKKICIDLLPNASQKVTLALGAELLKD